MSDLIDRQAAIEGILEFMPQKPNDDASIAEQVNYSAWCCALNCAEAFVRTMPPAQPEKRTEERTETHSCDCISRQAAIDALGERPMVWVESDYELGARNQYDADVCALETVPSAQPMRKKGTWISADAIFGGVPFYCSECGENTRDTVMGKPRWNFCPNCGADMRGEEE